MSERFVEQDYKSAKYCFLVTMNAAMGAIYVGWAIGVMNLMQPVLFVTQAIGDDSSASLYKGMQNCSMNIGAMAGALSGPFFLKAFNGRRKAMIVTDLIAIVACLLIWANNYWVTTWVSRLIQGYAVGLNSAIVPMYINEIAPKELKGMLGTCFQQSVNLGITLSYAFCCIFPDATEVAVDYKAPYYVYCIPIITCVLRIIGLSSAFNFETPAQLVQEAKEQEARVVLGKIYKEEKVQDLLDELTQGEATKTRTWGDMFSNKYRRRTIQAIMLQFLQQFSGINAVNYYSGEIFKNLTSDHGLLNAFVVIGGVCLIVGCLFTSALSRKYGRKCLLVANEITLTINLVMVAIIAILASNASGQTQDNLNIVATVFIFLFLALFQLGLGPIVWTYIPEIVPGEACAIATMTNYFAGAALGQIFPYLLDATSIQTCFFIFAGVCFCGFVFMQTQMIETKGKTPAEIEEAFGQGNVKTREENY